MEYKPQISSSPSFPPSKPLVKPRLIIHGGAGNITPESLDPEKYQTYRKALLTIVCKTHAYMTTPVRRAGSGSSSASSSSFPSALDTATYAVTQLEDNPLFNSGHGAVFTRDGINELEASVMVSRGHAKRGVGVLGLRRVKNPILLAKAMLEHGDDDLYGSGRGKKQAAAGSSSSPSIDALFPAETTIGGARTVFVAPGTGPHRCGDGSVIDAPSAQGHTQVFGKTAEVLARRYGLEMVHPRYFFTQARWDEHVRALEREKAGLAAVGTWSADEYLPQGTCGTVALDADGVVCAATSTGGMTNKLTGRIGDTACVGAGFWAEEWAEDGDPAGRGRAVRGGGGMLWDRAQELIRRPGPMLQLSDTLAGLLADCFPSPALYSPVPPPAQGQLTTTRCVGMSGTGNGDSFLRVAAVRTVAAIAHFTGVPSAEALRRIAGTGGELEKSAGDRWKRTGEGEGGVIGIECAVVRDGEGNVVETRSHILQDYNCAGMYRALIDDDDKAVVRIWRDDMTLPPGKGYEAEGRAEWVRDWVDEKEMLRTRE